MTMLAVDSAGRHTEASAAAAAAGGIRCVHRYHYNTTRAEVDVVHRAGLGFCLVAEFDTVTGWHPPLDSPETGAQHGLVAAQAARRKLGMPPGCKVTLTADTMVFPRDFGTVARYFQLAAPIIRDAGYLVEAYGGSLLIDHLHELGLADTTWEAAARAWSSPTGRLADYRPSQTATLRQLVEQRTYAGVTCDLNVFLGDPVGEWMPDGTASGHHPDPPVEDDMVHVITDARPGTPNFDTTWLLCGLIKRWLPTTGYADLYKQAAHDDPAHFTDHGMQGDGSPWIGLLDLAEQVGPNPS